MSWLYATPDQGIASSVLSALDCSVEFVISSFSRVDYGEIRFTLMLLNWESEEEVRKVMTIVDEQSILFRNN